MKMHTISILFLGGFLEFLGFLGNMAATETSPEPVGFEWYHDSSNYWPFEGVTRGTVKDYKGQNDGKISGDIQTIPGIVGSAIHLPGHRSWIDFGKLRSACLGDPESCSAGLTVAFWLRLPAFEAGAVILQLGRHRYSRGCSVWTRGTRQNKIAMSINTRKESFTWVEQWNADFWTHVAFTWNAHTLQIHFNCTLIKTLSQTVPARKDDSDEHMPLILGASHGRMKFARLQMDEFAIWNKTLSRNALCKIYQVRSVHGGYSSWTDFSSCSVTCGNGTKTRTRTCTNPSPQYRGRDCSSFGATTSSTNCLLGPCPIDGRYTEWSKFSACSKSCGIGERVRTRDCTNPSPAYGGLNCSRFGPERYVEHCNTHYCPIHGGYTVWSEFSPCTASCGNGTRGRTRNCSNPEPRYGGTNCSHLGPRVNVESCNRHPCPVHGGYTAWSDFSNCSRTCSNGTRRRSRHCTSPAPRLGGRNCTGLGPASEVVRCNVHPCPVQGGYSPWSKFTTCTKSCGNGTMRRTRSCTNPIPKFGGQNCSHLGQEEETRQCNTYPCPIDGGLTSWAEFSVCSKTCGYGETKRTRNCTNPKPKFGGRSCAHLGASVETKDCNSFPCPIHGRYSPWSNFSDCSKSCGNGTMKRARNCSNPAPKYEGKNCSRMGPSLQMKFCNTHPCPIHGGYTSWGNFTQCTKSCGNGTKIRTRNCTNPSPRFQGLDCTRFGPRTEMKDCNSFPCPIHGGYSPWSNFSDCSKSCGNGTMERARSCSNPSPKHEGRNCSRIGPQLQIEFCNIHPCPIHGGYTSWGNFTQCTKSCGNGTKIRTRNCTNPSPRFQGLNCTHFGPRTEMKDCNSFPCPIYGGYSPWSNFSDCSKSCGNGTMKRARNCSNPAPKYEGRNCSRIGPPLQIEFCNTHPCPIHGGYTSWGNFTRCTKSCGNGTKIRTRNCTNPSPRFQGLNCTRLGPRTEMKRCKVHPCPIDGGYTTWSEFGECSRSCANGTKTRRRTCTNPRPQFGGNNCSRFGVGEENYHCRLRPCPVDGGYGNWSNFTECTESCGGGTHERARHCDNPVPQYGGVSCEFMGPSTEKKKCNDFPCPIHGNYSEWTEYEPCTVTCSGGVRIRKRNCTSPPPAHGGRDCKGLGTAIQMLTCNEQDCPDIVFNVTVNLTDVTWVSLLEDMKTSKSLLLTMKIQVEVAEVMGEHTISRVDVYRFRKGSVIVDFSVNLLHKHYQGITPLQSAIHNKRRFVTMAVSPVGFSLASNNVPERAPILVGQNTSSTTILLRWSTIHPNHTHGEIRSYRLTYSKHDDERTRMSVVPRDPRTLEVNGLDRFTLYDFIITGENRRGYGVDSDTLSVGTDEDKPSGAPLIVKAVNTSSTSLLIAWQPIPQQSVHGELLGYNIYHLTNDGSNAQGVQKANASSSSAVVKDLKKFTSYSVNISGFTSKGEGPYSRIHDVVTDEDVPSKAPSGVVAYNTSSTSIEVKWVKLPLEYVHGNLLGYRVSYIARDLPHRKWQEQVVRNDTTEVVITNLVKYTRYIVQVEAFTKIGDGIPSKGREVWTDEDEPDAYPQNVTLMSPNSTEIFVEWQHIPKEYKNGILLGYNISFSANKSHGVWQTKTVRPAARHTLLSGLHKFTWYRIKVAGFTRKGLGPESPVILERTKEDVPSESVFSIIAHNASHTSIRVVWQHIPQDSIHGILKGYRVLFWRTNESRETAGEMEEVGPWNSSVILTDLWIYTKYTIQVLGFTTIGEGNISRPIVVSTDEYTPSLPPTDVQAFNRTNPTKIRVSWGPIPDDFYVHGILRGYKVAYKVVAIANETKKNAKEKVVTVGPKNQSVELEGLDAFIRYHIHVWAFTRIGDGVHSRLVIAETCNCYRDLFTNWWSNPPYVEKPLRPNKTGMIPPILRNVIYSCCAMCSEYGRSTVEFERTESGGPAEKSSLVDFQKSIGDDAELSFPVYGFMHQKHYLDNFSFVPIVQSPGVALIIIGDEEGSAAMVLIRSLALCWPILFLSMIMLWLFGVLVWLLEAHEFPSSRNFPRNVLLGSWEGIWWAFATMTTLGYGDRVPRTPLGRAVGMIWITTGIVMITCFNSTMTTMLTSSILESDIVLYGTEIGAIQNSPEFRLGIRKNARVNSKGKYVNLQQVYNALTSREVKAILVDTFTVGSRKDLFTRRDLYVNKILDYSAAYGVVLAGQGKKLHKCFQSYMKEQRSEVSEIISSNVQRIEEAKQSLSVERSGGLFDPKFPTYVKAVIVSGIILVILILLGAKFECAKKMGCFDSKAKESESIEKPKKSAAELLQHRGDIKKEMSLIVLEFKRRCEKLLSTLRQKHSRQHLRWAKLNPRTAKRPMYESKEKMSNWRNFDYVFDQIPETKYFDIGPKSYRKNGTYSTSAETEGSFV